MSQRGRLWRRSVERGIQALRPYVPSFVPSEAERRASPIWEREAAWVTDAHFVCLNKDFCYRVGQMAPVDRRAMKRRLADANAGGLVLHADSTALSASLDGRLVAVCSRDLPE